MKKGLILMLLGAVIAAWPCQQAAAQSAPLTEEDAKLLEEARRAFFLLGDVVGDSLLIRTARVYLKVFAGPLAVASLDHYLQGDGKRIDFDVAKMLANDAGVRQALQDAIKNRKSSRGTVTIPQTGPNAYANYEYRCALGAIQLNWSIEANGQVRVAFTKNYHWSPNNVMYVDQAVHQALERQKELGAKEFLIDGSTTITLKELNGPGETVRIVYDENALKPADIGPGTPAVNPGTLPGSNPTPRYLSPRSSATTPGAAYTPSRSGSVFVPNTSFSPSRSGSGTTPGTTPSSATTPSALNPVGTSMNPLGNASVPPATGQGTPIVRITYDESAPKSVAAPRGVAMRIGIDRGSLQRVETPAKLAAAIRADK